MIYLSDVHTTNPSLMREISDERIMNKLGTGKSMDIGSFVSYYTQSAERHIKFVIDDARNVSRTSPRDGFI